MWTKKTILLVIVILGTALTILFSVLTPTSFEPPVHADAATEKELAKERIKSAKPMPYDDLMKNTKQHRGTYVKYDGTIAYIERNGEKTTVLFAVYDPDINAINPRQTVFLEYPTGTSFKDNEQLTIYGYVDRNETFHSVTGEKYAYPIIQADVLESYTGEPMNIGS